MKIQPSSLEALRNGKEASAADRGPARASTAPAGGASGGDRVDLSALGTQIAARDPAVAEPAFDRARVEAIKQAIVEGRLTVDSEVVADRMVASALALLNRPAQ